MGSYWQTEYTEKNIQEKKRCHGVLGGHIQMKSFKAYTEEMSHKLDWGLPTATAHAKKMTPGQTEATYQGKKVPLNKPMAGDTKKSKVYVDPDGDGKATKVNFGHGGTSAKKAGQKTMRIRKSNPAARKSFRARHNCDNPGPKDKARYWSCRAW